MARPVEAFTEDNYIQSRIAQDTLIKREFVVVYEKFDRIDGTLQEHNERFDRIDATLQEHNERFDRIDATLQEHNERFDRIDERFDGIDERFDGIDERFDGIDGTLHEFRAMFARLEDLARNRMINRPWQRLAPVAVFEPGNGPRQPDYFPKTAREFWQLQNPGNAKRLAYLASFYDVQGHQYWKSASRIEGDDTQSSDEDSPTDSISLQKAVDLYPEQALREIAPRIGLDIQKLEKFYQKAKENARREHEPPFKRRLSNENRTLLPKREKLALTNPRPAGQVITMSQLMLEEEDVEEKSGKTRSTRLEWDMRDRSPEEKVSTQKSQSPSSKGDMGKSWTRERIVAHTRSGTSDSGKLSKPKSDARSSEPDRSGKGSMQRRDDHKSSPSKTESFSPSVYPENLRSTFPQPPLPSR